MLKAWREPGSENATFYVLVGIGAVVTLFIVTSAAPLAWSLAAYVLALTTLLVTIIVLRSPSTGTDDRVRDLVACPPRVTVRRAEAASYP